jgi:hypothetical protein
VRNIALFYDGLVVPGALLLLASGTWLIVEFYDGCTFLEVPWLAGMMLLFAFEFVEGNTITRLYFIKLRRLCLEAVRQGRFTAELEQVRAGAGTDVHAFPGPADPDADRLAIDASPELAPDRVVSPGRVPRGQIGISGGTMRSTDQQAGSRANQMAGSETDPQAKSRFGLRRILVKIGQFLRKLGDAWREPHPMWFPMLVAVAVVAALQTSQGVDLLVIASNDFRGSLFLLLSIAGFATTSWYFSRVVLDAAAQAANKRVEPKLGVRERGAPDTVEIAADRDIKARRNTVKTTASGIRYWRHIFRLALPHFHLLVWPLLPALVLAWQESRDESPITSWWRALWVLGFLLLLGLALVALASLHTSGQQAPKVATNTTRFAG